MNHHHLGWSFFISLLFSNLNLWVLSAPVHQHSLNTFTQEYVARCPYQDKKIPEMLRQVDDLDVWSIQDDTVDIRITNIDQDKLVHSVFAPLKCHVLIPKLQSFLREQELESITRKRRPFVNKDGLDDFFKDYQSYSSIVERMKSWSNRFTGKVEFIPSIGQSIEGRDIPAIKITNLNSNGPKKAIWWNSGQHAREWIGPATVLYICEKLLNSNDTKTAGWLDQLEFYVTPMQNPDGYEYTRTPGHRFWRKNRRRNADGSFGVDLNRNWDEHWAKTGSSYSPRSDIYHGQAPFSEPETKALSDFILSIPNRYAGIDFHSYSQLILRNWGWTTKSSKNEAILKKLGDGISKVIMNTSGEDYISEKGADLYPAAGASDDWMAVKAKMVGYTFELRDKGRFGFALPPRFIVPVGEEIWAAVNYFVDFLLENDIAPNEYI